MNLIKKANTDNLQLSQAEQIVKLETLKRDIDDKLKALRADLLKKTQELDVYTLKTGSYTISRASRQYVKVVDDKKAKQFLEGKNVPVVEKTVIDMDYMKKPIKQYLSERGHIPGVQDYTTEYVSIRINKKDKK